MMTKKTGSGFCGPSDEWIDRLSKAGCPMDRTITDKLRARGQTRAFLLRPAAGECRVFDMSHLGGTGYEIGLGIEVLQSRGLIVKDWYFTPPWSDHFITWGLERPRPSGTGDPRVEDPRDEELLAILDDRRRVMLAKPAEGWIFGQSNESIPDDVESHSFVFGQLTLAEENGAVGRMKIRLHVDRSARINLATTKPARHLGLFEDPDSTPDQ